MAAGRPRSFDLDKALGDALRVFLEKGYEGAYLGDLTRAMGINPPSLYAAFGSKEGLFRRVLERYVEERDARLSLALAAPTAYETIEQVLMGGVMGQTRDDRAPGCLLVQGALACAAQGDAIRAELGRCRMAGQLALAERLTRARSSGHLPEEADPDALAGYVFAVLHGMAVQAAGGASRETLLKTVALTMNALKIVTGDCDLTIDRG
jgi:AcrR family transcriptional regulator